MLLKRLALTAAAGAALVVALPAIADAPYWSHGYRGGHWHHDRYHRDYHRHRHIHRHGHREKVVVINERPYASAPPIVVLNPSPVYAPYPSSGPSQPGWDVNVGFRFGGSF